MAFNVQQMSLKIRKDLMGSSEKAKIVAAMRRQLPKHAWVWAMEFKRLPATIKKIAAEAGVALRD